MYQLVLIFLHILPGTLYNVFYEDDDGINEWMVAIFSFTDTTFTAYQINDPTERLDNMPYTITPEGYISFTEDSATEYIKGITKTDDYISILWDDVINVEDMTPNEHFYFDLQKATDFAAAQNAK